MSQQPILLFWNWQSQKWTDTEDYSYNGGTTLGKQWFFPPPLFVHTGKDQFTHQQPIKMVLVGSEYKAILKPLTPTPLETDKNSQMPFVNGRDLTDNFDVIAWFVPCSHPRFSRGKSEVPNIV